MTSSLPSRNLPVYTVSDRYLGRVVDVEVDATARAVTCYHVLAPLWFGGLWRKRLLVAPAQVVRITPERMVVEDAVVREPTTAPGIVPEVT